MSLTEQEIVRYSRHIILPEVGGRGQQRLKGASVLLAGVGASGSAAALYLAAAGIGRLALWDPGLLTPPDLEGAIAHAMDRVGQPRARSAAVSVGAVNPDARVEVLDRESDVVGALPDYQLLVASDGDWNALMRGVAGCGAVAVFMGARGGSGAVTSWREGQPCPLCLGSNSAAMLGLRPEGGVPAFAAAAGVIGVVGATEAVKLILGIGSPLFGRILTYDGLRARFGEEEYHRAVGCRACQA